MSFGADSAGRDSVENFHLRPRLSELLSESNLVSRCKQLLEIRLERFTYYVPLRSDSQYPPQITSLCRPSLHTVYVRPDLNVAIQTQSQRKSYQQPTTLRSCRRHLDTEAKNNVSKSKAGYRTYF